MKSTQSTSSNMGSFTFEQLDPQEEMSCFVTRSDTSFLQLDVVKPKQNQEVSAAFVH